MFGSESYDRGRWCGLLVATGLLALCMILLGSRAVTAGSPPPVSSLSPAQTGVGPATAGLAVAARDVVPTEDMLDGALTTPPSAPQVVYPQTLPPTLEWQTGRPVAGDPRPFPGAALAGSSAPLLAVPTRGDRGPDLGAPPVAGSADLVICLTSERVWGLAGAGDTVTVTVDGQQMGAAQADGQDFFWTTLFDSSGSWPGLGGGDVVRVYHEGAQADAVTLRSIDADIDVVDDVVSGTIGGVGGPISVTIYLPWGEPRLESISQTVDSEANGDFRVDFSGLWDLTSEDEAVVAYVEDGVEVHRHFYPDASLMVRPMWSLVRGFSQPGTMVTITLYGDNHTTKAQATVKADPRVGSFSKQFAAEFSEGYTVEVELEGDLVLSRTVDHLTETVDAVNDRVTGEAEEVGAVVVGIGSKLTPNGDRPVFVTTTVQAGGVYTLDFGGVADLMPGHWFGVYVPDAEGDDLNLWSFSPSVEVYQTWGQVAGRGPLGPGAATVGREVTLTLATTTTPYITTMDWWGGYEFYPPDIGPGQVVTVQAEGSPWLGVVEVQTMTVEADSTLDRFSGTVEPPTARVELWSGQMTNFGIDYLYPAGGSANVLVTATSPYTAEPPGFDVRNGVGYEAAHRTADDYAERVYGEVDWVQVWPQFNGLDAVLAPPGTAFTITLLTGGGTEKAHLDGESTGPIGQLEWQDFGDTGQQIETGDRVRVESAAGFSQTVDIVPFSVQVDTENDRFAGSGPADSLLYLNCDSHGRGFVPTGDSGAFLAQASGLQDLWGTGDLEWGDDAWACYTNSDGNRVCTFYGWPDISARYGMDGSANAVMGWTAFHEGPIQITVTHVISGEIYTGTAPLGACDWCGPYHYYLELPDGTLEPGAVSVTVDFGDGFVDTLHLVTMTGEPDLDLDRVVGTAPPNGILDAWASHPWGGQANVDGVEVDASGIYTVEFGPQDWDIQYGDWFNFYYRAPHGHTVEYYFWLPAPQVGVWKWNTGGHARPGGVYVYGVQYENSHNGVATDTVIVDTLPPSTTLAGDTSGLPVATDGGIVTWTVGNLGPGEQGAFMVTLNVDPAVVTGSQVITSNCVAITTTAPGDYDPGNDVGCSDPVDVWPDDVEIQVEKWANPGDPTPGQEFDYTVQWCNNRGAAVGPVWLTDTLPASTTLLYWEPQNWYERYWLDESPSEDFLVLYAPGLRSGCEDLTLRLLLDPGAEISTTLQNHVRIRAEGDVYTDNDQREDQFHVSDVRYDMNSDKWVNSGKLVPGGWVRFGANWWNAGNIATHAWLTDSLSPWASYRPDSGQRHDGEPFEPGIISDTHVVWDLDVVPVDDGLGLDFTLDVSAAFTAGNVLTNCVTVGITGTEDSPGDNTACTEVVINPSGPNLRVTKYHWWNGEGQLEYRIQFQNVGDEAIEGVWITDTLADGTHWNGWWDQWFEGDRLVSQDLQDHELKWQYSILYPGDSGEIGFQADLDDSSLRAQWYTNTVEITTPELDVNDEDNHYEDGAFNGPEVSRVEIFIMPGGDGNMYGDAQPGYPVTVTTPYSLVSTWTGDGYWQIDNVGPITPGDTITVEGGHGLMPVVIPVPDPFTAVPDMTEDTVKGQIQGWNNSPLQVHGYWPDGYWEGSTDASGYYTATFSDVPRGAQGHVRYETEITDAWVVLHLRYMSADLILQVNYAHDWIEGNYAPGHTVHLTVTQSDKLTPKGTASGTTGVLPWSGQVGFATGYNVLWDGDGPDIEPNDWVFGLVESDFYTSSAQVGTITGTLDYDANAVSGNVYAEWFDGPLNGWCSVWEENGPSRDFPVVDADGGAYACDFDPDWDLVPGQNVGVTYVEPDGDMIINVFQDATADVQTDKSGQGQPTPGGNYRYQVAVRNQGGAEASNVVLTDTLPDGLTYLEDTSGVAPTVDGQKVRWELGTLGGNVDSFFDVFCEVDPGLSPGTWLTNTLYITTTDYDGDPGNNYHEWSVDVAENDTHLGVGKWAWTGDPAAGQEVVFSVNVCNNGSTGSSLLTLTDTIHAPLSLVEWWPQHAGWTEVHSDDHSLHLTYPSFQAWWCSEIYLRTYVDPMAEPGDWVSNTAVITASNDMEPDGNESTWWGQVNHPHTNLYLDKYFNGGQLVQGGELRFNINYGNRGNVPVGGPLYITDTLPDWTSFVEWHEGGGPQPVWWDEGPGYVVWQIDGMVNGYDGNFEIVLRIDDEAPIGTVFTNTARLTCVPGEDLCSDNKSSVVDEVYATGPNLRVTKRHSWSDDGQQLDYRIRFENVGTETEYNVWLTDTLPEDTHWNGWWDQSYDWSRLLTQSLESDPMWWNYSELNPGDSGEIGFQADLDGPREPLRWYTNTVDITIPEFDISEEDNHYEDEAFGGGEIDQVDIDVHRNRIWGCAYSLPVTITTAFGQRVITDGDACWWDVRFTHPFTPGIEVTIAAGEGRLPVTVTIPDPFTARLSTESDQVWGQIDHLDGEPVWIQLWDHPDAVVNTDDDGNYDYTAGFDIPRGNRGDILYQTQVDYTQVGFHGRMDGQELILNLHYDGNHLWGNYEAGHTLWITVTEADGITPKGVQELTTWRIPWWDYEAGWETQGGAWLPGGDVDIQPYDWVYGRVDNGQTSHIHVGEISGNVDPDTDSIAGTIYADDWLADTVQVYCYPPEGPTRQDAVQANGLDVYTCSWDPGSEWDVLPGQGPDVQYVEPDGDTVQASFWAPAADVAVDKDGHGRPAPGGNYMYRIYVHNYGDLDADGVVLTDTLPGGMTYLEDTSGIVPEQDGNQITWDLGSVAGHIDSFFDVFVEVPDGLAPGDWMTNTVDIASASYDANLDNNHHEWPVQLVENATHLRVDKGAWTGDPAPGQDVVFSLNVCNQGDTASSQITLTDTLLPPMTVRNWWADVDGWSEVSRSDHELVLSHPAYANGWCFEVFLRASVDAGAEPDSPISNTVTISASNDLESGDNESTWYGSVGWPRTNLNLAKRWNWGELVPGGQTRWWIDLNNTGNVSVTSDILLTDILPANTQYVEAWLHRSFHEPLLLSPSLGPGTVVWNVGPLENGFSKGVEVILDIDEDEGLVGTFLTNTAEIGCLPGEESCDDNFGQAVEQVYGHGPNLRVRKEGGWHGYGDGHNAWFNVVVENVGDVGVQHVELNDSYPLSMTIDGELWNDEGQLEDWELNEDEHWFRMVFRDMYPGYRQDFGFSTAIPGSEPVPGGWILTNHAVIDSVEGEPTYQDNEDDAVLTTGPSLWLKKDLAGGHELPGQEVTFSLKFGNDRQGHESWWGTQGDVWVTDTLPAELTFITATRESWGWAGWEPDRRDGQQVAWNVGQMGAGYSDQILVVARVADTVESGDSFTNWAEAYSDRPDLDREVDTEDNRNHVDMLIGLPAFEVSKAVQSSGVAGTAVTYVLTVDNVGNADATGVLLSDTVPAGLSGIQGDYDAYDGQDVTWSLDILAGEADGGQFGGTLPCATGKFSNDTYRVVSSDQGVASAAGKAVSLRVVAPSLVAAFTQNATSVVAGGAVKFTDASTTNGGAITAWLWDFGDGKTGNKKTMSHVYDTPGTYSVKLTVTDGCGFSKQIEKQNAVTVVSGCTPPAGLSFSYEPLNPMFSVPISFTAAITAGSSPVTYDWDFDDGGTATGQSVQHTYAAVGDYEVTVTASNACGTPSTSQTVTVRPRQVYLPVVFKNH